MVLKHDLSFMSYLYQNPPFLNYIRYNPQWYKILYYEPNRFNEFLDEAKKEMNITFQDRIKKFQTQLNFVQQIAQYISK